MSASLATLVDGSPDGIVVVDADGRVRYANPAAGALFQRPIGELVGELFGTPVSAGERVELDVPRRAGLPRTVELHASGVPWEGAPCLALVLRDVTERARAQARVEHLNRVLGAIRDVGQVIVQEKDPARLVERVCEVLVAGRGLSGVWLAVEPQPGLPALFALAGGSEPFRRLALSIGDGRRPRCLCAELRTGGAPPTIDEGCVPCDACDLEDGGRVALLPLQHHGRVCGSLGVMVPAGAPSDPAAHELLEDVAADLALALHDLAAERARQASEAQYRTIFDSVNDVIVVVDAETGQTLDVNARVTAVFGWSREEFCRLAWNEWGSDPFGGGGDAFDRFLRRAAEGHPTTFAWCGRHRDGRPVWTEISLQRGEIGGLPRVLAVVRDVTARRAMEEQLAQSDRLASVGLLAAGVAHEINNPLTYILFNLEELATDLPPVAAAVAELRGRAAELPALDPQRLAELAKGAGEALEGAERVRRIVRDLGTFARSDEEAVAPVPLDRVAERAIGMAFNEIRHRARLVRSLGAPEPVVASEGRLGQVFLNLLINAVHAVPEGASGAHEIRVRTFQVGQEAVFEVRDTGCGIPAANLPRLFEPFFTTKGVGVGSGLGLSICRNIVTAYGGGITVDSVEGRGTTVTVRLPVAARGSQAVESAVRPAPEEQARGVPRRRLLVVDDEPLVGRALERQLAADHEVVLVHSGAAAQALLAEDCTFDGVLCDLMMPDINGMKLYEWLRTAHPALARATVFITGGAFTPGSQAFLESAPGPVLEKPLDTARLRAALRALAAN